MPTPASFDRVLAPAPGLPFRGVPWHQEGWLVCDLLLCTHSHNRVLGRSASLLFSRSSRHPRGDRSSSLIRWTSLCGVPERTWYVSVEMPAVEFCLRTLQHMNISILPVSRCTPLEYPASSC